MRALIVLGGDAPGHALLARCAQNAQLVIAADRGLAAFSGTSVVPDLVVGDMDSVPQEVLSQYEGKALRLNPVKDDTDAEHALGVAVSRGANEIVFLGALGGRLDHALANVMLLVRAHQLGADAQMLDEHVCIRHVNRTLTLHGKAGDTVSVLPLGRAQGVSLTGFFYPLSGHTMTSDNSLGVSNVMTQETAEISVCSGDVIVFHYYNGLQ